MVTREEGRRIRKRKLEKELAETRAEQRGKVIVETKEDELPVLTERTPGEAAELQAIQQEKEKAGIRAEEAAKFPTQVETQEEILERERRRREGVTVAELPPEALPPVTAPVAVEPEVTGFARDIKAAEELIEKGPLGDKSLIGRGSLILSVTPGGTALNSAKVATGIRATKAWTGMLKLLKTNWKKLVKWTAIGYALWSERSIGNIDSALSQVRESITLPVSLAATNPNEISNAFDMITELEEDIRRYESDVKLKEIYSPTFKLTGRTQPIYQRIKKLDVAILLARQQIARTEALGRPLTDEETTLALNNMNIILNQMEKPSKFLGII